MIETVVYAINARPVWSSASGSLRDEKVPDDLKWWMEIESASMGPIRQLSGQSDAQAVGLFFAYYYISNYLCRLVVICFALYVVE